MNDYLFTVQYEMYNTLETVKFIKWFENVKDALAEKKRILDRGFVILFDFTRFSVSMPFPDRLDVIVERVNKCQNQERLQDD